MKPFFKYISLFLFLIFILTFSWQTRLIFSPIYINNWYFEYASLSLYFSDILILSSALFFLVFFFSKFSLNKLVFNKINFFWYILGAWELFLIISISQAVNWQLSLWHYLWFIFLGLIVYLFSEFFKKNSNLILNFFLIGAFPQALLAIWQFFSQRAFSFKYLGLASHHPSLLGDVVIETTSGRWLRAYGGLDHPNILAALLAMVALLVTSLLLKEAKKELNLNRLLRSVWLWLVLLVNFLALFLTFSRSVWLAFILAMFVLIGFSLREKKIRVQAIKIFLSLLVFSFILTQIYSFLIFQRFDLNSRLENKSVSERYSQIFEAKEIIENNIYLGIGLGNYSLKLQEKNPLTPAFSWQPVHNSFLLLWAETGIFSLIAFCFLIAYGFIKTWQKKQTLGLSLLVLLSIVLLSEHWLFSLHFGWIFLGLIFSIIFIVEDKIEISPFFSVKKNKTKLSDNLLNKNKNQILIFCCPAYFPLNFFRHSWIVINKKGITTRLEIRHDVNLGSKNHLFVNNQPPLEGINKSFFIKSKWSPKLLKVIENELAEEIIYFIEKSLKDYPYIYKYKGNGPNCNTFIQWILDQFPKINLKLSWRFIGKKYMSSKGLDRAIKNK